MGLIKAFVGAAGGVLADQWKEAFVADSMDSDVLVAKGRRKTSGRSSNTKGSENVITTGSMIIVAAAMTVTVTEAVPAAMTTVTAAVAAVMTIAIRRGISGSSWLVRSCSSWAC